MILEIAIAKLLFGKRKKRTFRVDPKFYKSYEKAMASAKAEKTKPKSSVFGSPKYDNQGRNLDAVKKHQDTLARHAEQGRAASHEAFEKLTQKHPLADWTHVQGVAVLRSGQSRYVGVPSNGKKTAKLFDVIDLLAGKSLVQLKSSEVRGWLLRAAQADDENE